MAFPLTLSLIIHIVGLFKANNNRRGKTQQIRFNHKYILKPKRPSYKSRKYALQPAIYIPSARKDPYTKYSLLEIKKTITNWESS